MQHISYGQGHKVRTHKVPNSRTQRHRPYTEAEQQKRLAKQARKQLKQLSKEAVPSVVLTDRYVTRMFQVVEAELGALRSRLHEGVSATQRVLTQVYPCLIKEMKQATLAFHLYSLQFEDAKKGLIWCGWEPTQDAICRLELVQKTARICLAQLLETPVGSLAYEEHYKHWLALDCAALLDDPAAFKGPLKKVTEQLNVLRQTQSEVQRYAALLDGRLESFAELLTEIQQGKSQPHIDEVAEGMQGYFATSLFLEHCEQHTL